MKVLFAVNDEKISKNIIKKYQAMYKEIISWKNVYFYNAINKELQNDKTYDRIVIGEELEPSNGYSMNDNILFEKLDSITDEALNSLKGDIPIIFIASDKRDFGNPILIKLFGIGIYNVIIGKDRSLENVCKLISNPRTKKEAKVYYQINADDMDYESVEHDGVSEMEIQNIIMHYKKIGKNEEKYISSFNEIAKQYTDEQLKLITKFLPLDVRAVLEEKSDKYQQVMIGSVKGQIESVRSKEPERKTFSSMNINSHNVNKIGLIDKELGKSKLTKSVVIPSNINMQSVRKAYSNEEEKDDGIKTSIPKRTQKIETRRTSNIESLEDLNTQFEKGRTTTSSFEESDINDLEIGDVKPVKRGRGRPKKVKTEEEIIEEKIAKPVKRGRGRPKKIVEEEILLPGFDEPEETILPGFDEDDSLEQFDDSKETILPGFDEDDSLEQFDNSKETILPGFDEDDSLEQFDEPEQNISNNYQQEQSSNNNFNSNTNRQANQFLNYNNTSTSMKPIEPEIDEALSNLITGDKKIAAFVGTSKNGTSFLVNNLAVNLSQKGIKTAILDLTKNKNAYYIYTANDDFLRERAFRCIEGLRSGIAEGIEVNKNLSVYTTVPEDNESFNDVNNILETLIKNYSLVLLDCDFNTNLSYFANAQELYLVQSYDILTIQPLTAFLNEMKHKNILDQNKLRIVINKTLKLRKLTNQMIVGGISCYNDPASTFINTLFNKDVVRYTTVPFEEQTYARYLERIVDCEISLKGYSRYFLDALENLSNMVYPLIANNNVSKVKNYNNYSNNKNNNSSVFNNNMNETLNKMRNNF